jgi:hypothetical protein
MADEGGNADWAKLSTKPFIATKNTKNQRVNKALKAPIGARNTFIWNLYLFVHFCGYTELRFAATIARWRRTASRPIRPLW